jgi:hypothetical protein
MTNPTNQSALLPLFKAIEAAVTGDMELYELLQDRRFYGDTPPTGSHPPYITVGTTSEDPADTFGTYGSQGILELHLWGRSRAQALEMWGHVKRILHDTALPLDGHQLITGSIRFVTDSRDPVEPVWHAVTQYAYRTMAVAEA